MITVHNINIDINYPRNEYLSIEELIDLFLEIKKGESNFYNHYNIIAKLEYLTFISRLRYYLETCKIRNDMHIINPPNHDYHPWYSMVRRTIYAAMEWLNRKIFYGQLPTVHMIHCYYQIENTYNKLTKNPILKDDVTTLGGLHRLIEYYFIISFILANKFSPIKSETT